jgi:hypothetical protein
MKLSIRKVSIALALTIASATNLFVQSNPVFAKPTVVVDRATTVTNGLIRERDSLCLAASSDLAAKEIKYTLLRKDSPYKGRVKITGVIQNVGRRQYVEVPGTAQLVSLSESNDTSVSPSPSSFRTFRGEQRIPNLLPGEKMEISYETEWITSNEFPPVYAVTIYAFEANYDCNTSNNRIQRQGEPINALFTR